MKAGVLAGALDGRVIGNADVEIARAVHPTEATHESDVAIAISPDTIRMLDRSRATTVLTLEGVEFPEQRFHTTIFIRQSRSNLPTITQLFRPRPAINPGIHPSAVIAPGAMISKDAAIGPLVVIGP